MVLRIRPAFHKGKVHIIVGSAGNWECLLDVPVLSTEREQVTRYKVQDTRQRHVK